jgi:hypothetical protein
MMYSYYKLMQHKMILKNNIELFHYYYILIVVKIKDPNKHFKSFNKHIKLF